MLKGMGKVERIKIVNYLDKLEFKHANRGFGYLIDAIVLSAENPEILDAVCKELYPAVAELHNTTASRVERAIRHAIETSNAGKITNSEFIARAKDNFIYGSD
jgi:two-component system, response regulator, stage 0 sporulation protein A